MLLPLLLERSVRVMQLRQLNSNNKRNIEQVLNNASFYFTWWEQRFVDIIPIIEGPKKILRMPISEPLANNKINVFTNTPIHICHVFAIRIKFVTWVFVTALSHHFTLQLVQTSKEPVCPRVELILKIIIILLIIFLGFIKSKPC